jgi:hypothetical protein
MAFEEELQRLARETRHETRVTEGQRHDEHMARPALTLMLDLGLPPIDLGLARTELQRDEGFLTMLLDPRHVVANLRLPTRIVVLVLEAVKDPLSRMALLLGSSSRR